MFVLQTVLEFLAAGLIIVGLFNEEKLVRFEDKVIAAIKRRIKAHKRSEVYRHESRDDRSCA